MKPAAWIETESTRHPDRYSFGKTLHDYEGIFFLLANARLNLLYKIWGRWKFMTPPNHTNCYCPTNKIFEHWNAKVVKSLEKSMVGWKLTPPSTVTSSNFSYKTKNVAFIPDEPIFTQVVLFLQESGYKITLSYHYWQYTARSIWGGIGFISVPSSCSIRYL